MSTKMIRASEYSSSSSFQTYQSRSGEPFGAFLARWNHSWSDEVWFITRSAMIRMPRSWAASMSARMSSIVP
ncbi:unannotated protein [freshwater metagenome]|uniref:Unannotated protein n=1 Tax=freshwater metagenome TaxID=449393 RepID=A0A6J7JUJ8_9ZZZZ